jgi:16S rRNA (adenine1518-N6/adenine1519-N6)-dimethyltransferase
MLEATARVIDAAFAQRRKTIRNSMSSSGFDKAALDEAFARVGIEPTVRAERLSTEDFVNLARELGEGALA